MLVSARTPECKLRGALRNASHSRIENSIPKTLLFCNRLAGHARSRAKHAPAKSMPWRLCAILTAPNGSWWRTKVSGVARPPDRSLEPQATNLRVLVLQYPRWGMLHNFFTPDPYPANPKRTPRLFAQLLKPLLISHLLSSWPASYTLTKCLSLYEYLLFPSKP